MLPDNNDNQQIDNNIQPQNEINNNNGNNDNNQGDNNNNNNNNNFVHVLNWDTNNTSSYINISRDFYNQKNITKP